MKETKWQKNVILADADYVDKVAFDLTVNFERMLGRRIPKTDMATWLECIALDGGMRFQEEDTPDKAGGAQVILLHGSERQLLANFTPGHYADELDGKAFTGRLGEFLISCVPVEDMVSTADLFTDSLGIIANAAEVERLMVIPDAEHIYNKVRDTLRHADPAKHITVFTMDPSASGPFRQELLGYSLMAALGIKSEELAFKK